MNWNHFLPAISLALALGSSLTLAQGAPHHRSKPVFQAPSPEPRFSTSPKAGEFRHSHILAEPLVPLGGIPSMQENQALARALLSFHRRIREDDLSSLDAFLQRFPESTWKPGLLLNMGVMYFKSGHLSKSFATLREGWNLSKTARASDEKRVADRLFAELVKMHGRMGRWDTLETLFREVGDRTFQGPASEGVRAARDGLIMMKNRPQEAFRCGPIALTTLMEFTRTGSNYYGKILAAQSTPKGMSMRTVAELARQVGMKYRLAKRQPGAPLILPSLLHWKERHYSALLRRDGDRYHIVDPTFREDLWMTMEALDAEASGYFLVPEGQQLPPGWTPVTEEEVADVWGAAGFANNDAQGTSENDSRVGGASGSDGTPPGGSGTAGGEGEGGENPPNCGVSGMPVYSFHTMVASLNIVDVPVGHTPPRGPSVNFRVTYNQREAGQPTTFNYSNLGPKWTFGWLGYLTDNPTFSLHYPTVYPRGGGAEPHGGLDTTTGYYTVQPLSRTRLKRIALNQPFYERNFADGSKEIYSLSNGATSHPRKVFLTHVIDVRGDTMAFSYDSKYRLRTVTDALGQVTTLDYELGADSLKITKVTDPFGRYATFAYDAQGQLISITDVAGLQSQFTYESSSSDFISAMTTPYGTTRFAWAEFGDRGRSIEATDPMGRTERLEYRHDAPGIGPEPLVPAGMTTENSAAVISKRNTFYWDKKAMQTHPGDYQKARIFHWMHTGDINGTGRIMSSMKPPLESRIWYNYPGQGSAEYMSLGMLGRPSAVGRVLDDSTTQLYQYQYDALGNLTQAMDPVGRITHFAYGSNGIDLLSIRQKNGLGTDLLDTLTYNSQHLPLTSTNASGQVDSFTYNARGQMLSATNPRGETTTYTYDTSGYLTRFTGPVPGDTTIFAYDGHGRLSAVTDRDGHRVRAEYDALDRRTKVVYPDSSFQQYVYDKLDLSKSRDRRGRWSRYFYNAVRELAAVQDPLGRTTNMEWCGCGGMESLTDPMGHVTRWTRDVQGRVIEKAYADGRKLTYAYQNTSSLLRSVTDARDQVKTFQYFKDGNLKSFGYTDAHIATPTVSYTYDSTYDRVASMTDGVGLTTYAYRAVTVPATLGAGALASLDGPFSNDSILFAYDTLGRVIATRIDGVLDSVVFDSLGRITTAINALGSFTYKYVGITGRLDSLLIPNGQKTAYSYFNVAGDLRLQEIKNLNPAIALLSRFAYTYDPEGQIKTWAQQADSTATQMHHLANDPVDQILGDVVKNVVSGAVLKNYAYAYDKAGNRLSAQEDSLLHGFAYNSLNQLTSQQGGGRMRFRGRLGEPGTLTLDGGAAEVAADSTFDAQVTVNPGTDTVTLVARDYADNALTNRYEVSSSGSSASFTYDLNGNLTGDGSRTFEWDAEDRLVAVNQGLMRSEFTYDGLGRRIRIVELNNGSVSSQKNFLWVGNQIAEERDASGGTVAKRYFGQGVQVGTSRFYYTRDHLGSVRELTDSVGTVVARYAYDPYGTRTKISGSGEAEFGFTGHYLHVPSGLYLTKYRAYSSALGRWISRDPIEEDDGPNLYAYVGNDPINYWDDDGLSKRRGPRRNNVPSFGAPPGQTRPNGQSKSGQADGLPPSCPRYANPGSGEPANTPPQPVPPIGGYRPPASGQSEASANRDRNRGRGTPDSQIGPSGKPKSHGVDHPSKKAAREAAERESKGKPPMHHPNPKNGPPHYHPTNGKGDKSLPNIHHNYPR